MGDRLVFKTEKLDDINHARVEGQSPGAEPDPFWKLSDYLNL